MGNMRKFIGTTQAECEAFIAGVDFADDSGELNFSKPVHRGDNLWETMLVDDTDEEE
jgi:hypothetical protein